MAVLVIVSRTEHNDSSCLRNRNLSTPTNSLLLDHLFIQKACMLCTLKNDFLVHVNLSKRFGLILKIRNFIYQYLTNKVKVANLICTVRLIWLNFILEVIERFSETSLINSSFPVIDFTRIFNYNSNFK